MWCYTQVKKLRHEYLHKDKKVTREERKLLEEYINTKKQFSDKPGNNRKHELKAENLLKQIEGDPS